MARARAMTATENGDRLWTLPFVFALLSVLLVYGAFYLTLIALPKYLKDNLGSGAAQIGLITGLFSVAAMVPRPFVGRVADRGGAHGPMLLATIIFTIASPLYIAATTIPRLIAVRLFHGTGMAFYTTAAPTLVASLAPPARRAEAMGYWGMANTLSLATFPALGLFVIERWGYAVVFVTASAVSVLGVIVTILIQPRRTTKRALSGSPSVVAGGLFERRVLGTTVIGFVLAVSYNIVLSFTALLADERRIAGAGAFFAFFAVALFTYRVVGRRLADRRGRWAVILPGYVAMGIGMLVAAFAHSLAALAIVAMLTGIGFGAAQPALLALAVDLVPLERRGAAMATFYVGWEIGAASGSIILGAIAQRTTYGGMYLVSSVLLLGTVVVLLIRFRRTGRIQMDKAIR